MAAGLGFKDFVTGEVLTAADVDGYLMQGVWVFASAAARDAAVTSPQEGNFAYLKDTNVTTYYTGSAWANLDTTGMTNPMTTTGDTIYSSPGSTPVRLGIGSTGDVLTVAGGVPTWAAPAGGGGMTLLSTTTLSGSNTSITGISGSYKDLKILMYGASLSSNATLSVKLSGNSTDHYTNQVIRAVTTAVTEQLYASSMRLIGNGALASNTVNAYSLTVSNYANEAGTSTKPYFFFGGYTDDGSRISPIFGGGYFTGTSAITQVDISVSAGSFNAGTVKVYGVN
jgi:hypothetical protein